MLSLYFKKCKSLLNPLRKDPFFFCQKVGGFGSHNSLAIGCCIWKIFKLRFTVHDQNPFHGNLRGQNLQFGWKQGYWISHTP